MSDVDSWREEKQSAWLYRELADCETDARIAELFRALAAAADCQADTWRAQSGSRTTVVHAVRACTHHGDAGARARARGASSRCSRR